MKRTTSILALIISAAVIFSSCNRHTPLLEDLGTQLENVVSLTLQNGDGETVEVTDGEDFAWLSSYYKSEPMPEERELEIFDSSNFTLCSVITNDNKEIAFYIWNTGEAICSFGEDLDSEFYIYTANNESDKTDSDYVEKMFKKYK